jgi:predicted PurR-regulated permease PerM
MLLIKAIMDNNTQPAVDHTQLLVDAVSDTPPLPSNIAIMVQGLALRIIATVALIYALNWAQGFLVSLLLGILLAYTLNPLVEWLGKIKIPRATAATLVMIIVIWGLLFGAYSLSGQIQSIIIQLPEEANKLSAELLRTQKVSLINFQKMQNAASTIEKATSAVSGTLPVQHTTHIIVDSSPFKVGNFIWASSKGVLAFIGEILMIIFLAYFILLSGDSFKRKLVRLTGPSLTKRKITVHILDDINDSIQNYMLMLLFTNVLVGLLTWGALSWFGLENAGAWAVAAALMHLIPYFGPLVTALVTGMAAFMQFDTLLVAASVGGISLLIAAFIGIFVTTWLTGRIARMNAVAVFISLLFWTWLWGIWGMLLSIPITVIVKVVSQHIEQLRPIAELLGDNSSLTSK